MWKWARRSFITGTVMVGSLLVASEASANYYINSVVNNSSEPVNVSSVVDPGKSIKTSNLGWNGRLLTVSGTSLGLIKISEDGSKCPGASWAAEIEHGNQKWGFAYEGNGAINITINADSSVTVGGSGTPGGNGRVIPGGCAAATPTPTPTPTATIICWYNANYAYTGSDSVGRNTPAYPVEVATRTGNGGDYVWAWGLVAHDGTNCPRPRLPGH
jgi:hypothetical protein